MQYTIYIYDEETNKLSDTITPSNWDSLKAMLYNLSDRNNGYLISINKPLNSITSKTKEQSNSLKFHCRHIYENNGNFIHNML